MSMMNMISERLKQAGTAQSRRTIDVVGVGLCLALTALLYAVGVHPMLEHRWEQQAMRRELLAERKELATLTASLDRLRQQYASVQRVVADNALWLEPVSALNRRVAMLAQMARQAGLEVEGVRPGQPPGVSEYYRTVPVRMNGRGSFLAVGRFLHELHRELQDVGVWSIQVEKRGEGQGLEPQFQLELVWYAALPTE